MQTRILASILLLFTIGSYAQEQKHSNKSNADIFIEASGSLIKKEFIDMGSVKRCLFQVSYFTDMVKETKVSAIRLDYKFSSSYSTDTKLALIDKDEVDAFLKAITIIQSNMAAATPGYYTELVYKSRGGMTAGCYVSDGKWKAFLKLEEYDDNSFVLINSEDLNEIERLILACKQKL